MSVASENLPSFRRHVNIPMECPLKIELSALTVASAFLTFRNCVT